jgi:hypothetical protein
MFIAIKINILTHKYLLQVLRIVFFKIKACWKIHYLYDILNIAVVEINVKIEVNTPS